MKKSTNHKVGGVVNTIAAATLASVFVFNVGSWVVDASEEESNRISREASGSEGFINTAPKNLKDKGEVGELLVYAKNAGVVLSGPLALLFGGLAFRRFDKAKGAKYHEENPNHKIAPYNHEEDLYLRYVHHKESGSGRHKMYPVEDQKRFDARYESGRSQAPEASEASELNNS